MAGLQCGSCVGVLVETGLTGELCLDVLKAEAGDDGNAIPLIQAVMGDLVSQLFKSSGGELVVLALGFLDGQDINVIPAQHFHHSVEASSSRIDVPDTDSHINDCKRGTKRWPHALNKAVTK